MEVVNICEGFAGRVLVHLADGKTRFRVTFAADGTLLWVDRKAHVKTGYRMMDTSTEVAKRVVAEARIVLKEGGFEV